MGGKSKKTKSSTKKSSRQDDEDPLEQFLEAEVEKKAKTIEMFDGSSDSEGESSSDESSSSGSSSSSDSESDNGHHQHDSDSDSYDAEQPINTNAGAASFSKNELESMKGTILDPSTRTAISSGYELRYITLSSRGKLGTLDSPKIELRADGTTQSAKNSRAKSQKEKMMVNIESMYITRVVNTYPVAIKANINGLKKAKFIPHQVNGVVGHYIAAAGEKETFQNARCIMHSSEKTNDPFLSKYPDLTESSLTHGLQDSQGMCIMTESSPLCDYLTNFKKVKVTSHENYKLVNEKIKNEAIGEILEKMGSRTSCDLNDVSITIERAYQNDTMTNASWTDLKEIDVALDGFSLDIRGEKEREILGRPCEFRLEIMIAYKSV